MSFNFYKQMKTVLLLLVGLFLSSGLYAQLSGIKTIDPAGSGANNYTSVASAILDLNANGVGAGGVTFNVASGATFSESADMVINTTTSSATSPIIFQKSGVGASPIIRAKTGVAATTTYGNNGDFVIKLISTDYVTFDGLDFRSNSTATTATTIAEYGIFLNKTVTDACKNITVKNCNFNLNKTSSYTIGIYQSNLISAAPATAATVATVTSQGGRSENNVFINNTFDNTYHGIYLNGFSHTTAPYDFLDNNNRVSGNTITNFGGASVTCYGIYNINQDSLTCRENTITGGSGSSTLYGIYNTGGTNTALTYSKNTISLASIGTSSTYGVYVAGSSASATPNNTVNIDSNTVQNCVFTSTSTLYGVYATTPAKYLNVRRNRVADNTTNATVYAIYISSSSTVTDLLLANNTVENHNRSLSTMTGSFYGIYNTSYKNGLIYNNTISRIYNKAGNTGSMYGYYDFAGAANLTAYNNTVDSIYSNGAPFSLYGMYFSNTGISNKNIYDNKITRLYSQGGGTIYGLYTSGGDTSFIYRNKISDLKLDSARAITMVGMYIFSGSGITAYSNSISDLKSLNSWTSSNSAIRGAYITSTNCKFYNNTIAFAATSTTTNAAGFGTAAIEANTTPTNLDFRNNIFINKSTNVLPGKTVGLRLQSTTLTAINSSFNNNIYYTTATPTSATPVFFDGTNVDTTIDMLKARLAPAESNAVFEDVPFVNSTTTPFDVHINPSIATRAESGATVIADVTTDIDGATRSTTTPDVGADEGTFTAVIGDFAGPVFTNISISPTGTGACNAVPHVLTATITDASGVASASILWKKDNVTQVAIPMTRGASNVWTGTIPAQYATKKSISVSWNLSAADSATVPNSTSYLGTTYKDADLYIDAGYTGLDTINAGGTVQFNAAATAALVNPGVNNSTFNSSASPFFRGYGGIKHNHLYKASELTASGLPAGAINSLGFDVTNAAGATNGQPSFTIYIDSSNISALTSTFISNAGAAVYGPVTYSPTIGVNTFALATPFVWNGTSNIIVSICYSENTWTFQPTSYVKSSLTSYASTTWAHIDNLTPAAMCATTTGNAALSRPDILFGYNPPRTYAWTSTPSGVLSSTTILNPVATIATAGNYQFIVSVNNGTCTNMDTVNIVAVLPQKPVPNFTASATTANIGGTPTTVTFTDQSTNVPDSYKWTFTPNAVLYMGGTNSTSMNPQVQFTGKGPYDVKLRVANLGGADSLTKTSYISTLVTYCSSTATSTADDDIGNVTISDFATGTTLLSNGIDSPFISRVDNNKLYTNWFDSTAVAIPALYKGDKYSLKIGRTYTGTFPYTNHATAYIDYNDNGSFTDAGEMIDIGVFSPTTTNNRTNTLFTVPCTADTGYHKMRIVLIETSSTLPSASCGTYTWGETEDYKIRVLPTQLVLDSLTTLQSDLTDVQPNTVNNVIAVAKVVARGCDGVLPATQFSISTTGTTNLADITNAKLWYTGASPVFANTQQYGSTLAAGATLTFTGSTPLLADTNYFWLTYDIAAGATLTNVVDATINTVTIGGVATVPTVTSPAGVRVINFPVSVVNNNTIQNTAAVSRSSNDEVILKGVLKMTSLGAAVNMSQVKVALTGSTRKADIKNVKVWFTGSNKNFNPATATQYDTTRAILSDTMTFAGTASVGVDTNYVWLTYSVKDTAKIANVLDGEFLSYTINSIVSTPANTNPAGSRKIIGAYCIPTIFATNDEDIGKFTLGSFSNGVDTPISSNPLSTNTYSNFLTLPGVTAQKAVATPVTVSIINSASFIYTTSVNVYIDYNQNGTFDVPAERVFKAVAPGTITARTVSGNITVPITAPTGLTRMRVTANETSTQDLDPCGNFTWGEVEDYMINITPPPPGDYFPPTFGAKTITPAGGACTPSSHTITVAVSDTTGVDTVYLNWTANKVVQPSIVMTNTAGIYSGVIPASGTDAISYDFKAIDNSANHNVSTYAGGSYLDGQLQSVLKASADGYIGVGGSYQLNATISNAKQVGTGTTVTTGLPNPYYTTWWGNKEQYLIPASELLAAGLSAGPITTLGLNVGNVTTTLSLTNFAISIGNTALTAISSTFQTGLTPVFTTPSYTTVPNSMNTHIFQTPFVWDGVSNIIIESCFNNSAYNGSTQVNTSPTSYPASVYSTQDNPTVCANASGNVLSSRPNFLLGQPMTLTYTWTNPTAGGLSSTTIANPVATPTGGLGVYQYIVNVNDGTCTATDTVLVNVIPPPTVNLGPNQVLCSGSSLTLNAGNAGSSFVWSSGETTQSIDVTVGATYIVSVTNQAGLIGRDTILITQVAAPSVNLGVDTVTLCAGSPQTFDAGNAGATYLWSTGATTQTVSLSAPGVYHVAVTNTNGCTTTDSVTILNNAAPAVALGADQSVCDGTPVTLDAGNPGSTYLWSNGATAQVMTSSAAGTYSVIVTNTNGCVAHDTVVVSHKAKPVVSLGANVSKCPSDSVTLNAGAGFASYSWTGGATTQSIKVAAPGQYIVTVSNADGCTAKDTIVVTNYALPTVALGVDQNICTSDTLTLDAGNAGSTYLWSTGATTRTIKVSLAGTYSVTVTSAQGCSNSDAVIITNKAIPDATWAIDTATGQSVTFKSTSTVGLQFAWNFGDPTSAANTSQLSSPTHVYTAAGNYTVTLTVTNVATGCRATITQQVTVLGVGNNYTEVFKLNVAPNPFVGQTKINYVLPENANNVSIEVYDMIGRKVATVISGDYQAAGAYQFEYKNEDLQTASGVYMVRLIVDGKIAYTRIIDLAKN
jgi:PKD repeat protein